MGMRRLALLVGLVAGSLVASPAWSQNEAPVQLEAEIGLDGWIDDTEPSLLRVTVSSDVLAAGHLEIDGLGGETTIPIEVPAGSAKTYNLYLEPTVSGSTITVRYFPTGSDRALIATQVRPRQPADVVLVGIFQQPDLNLPPLTDGDLRVEEIFLDTLDVDLAPLDYLILGRAADDEEALAGWIEGGGVVIEDPGVVPTLWPRARNLEPMDFGWSQPSARMVQAAAALHPRGFADLRLLGLIGLYGVLAGPVNFIVLKRMKRRELAWITVPALGLLATFGVVGFTMLGPDDSQFAVATIADGSSARRHSILWASQSGSGAVEVGFPEGHVVASGGGPDFGAPEPVEIISDSSARIDFRGGGYSSIGWEAEAWGLPEVEVGSDGQVRITNASSTRYEIYGAVIDGLTVMFGEDGLAPGDSGDLDPSGEIFEGGLVPHQVMDVWWGTYEPLLAAAATRIDPRVDRYVFAGYRASTPVMVNGVLDQVREIVVAVVPIESVIDLGRATGRVLTASPNATIERNLGWQAVNGEWAVTKFEVPTDREVSLEAQPEMGPVSFEAWNWTEASYQSINPGSVEDPLIGPDGTVLLRLSSGGMGFIPVLSVRLTWDP